LRLTEIDGGLVAPNAPKGNTVKGRGDWPLLRTRIDARLTHAGGTLAGAAPSPHHHVAPTSWASWNCADPDRQDAFCAIPLWPRPIELGRPDSVGLGFSSDRMNPERHDHICGVRHRTFCGCVRGFARYSLDSTESFQPRLIDVCSRRLYPRSSLDRCSPSTIQPRSSN